MHADHANLIMQYISIWQFDAEIRHIVVIVRILRSFLWYAMNELMHVMKLWFFQAKHRKWSNVWSDWTDLWSRCHRCTCALLLEFKVEAPSLQCAWSVGRCCWWGFFSFSLGFLISILLYHLINWQTHIGFWLVFFFFGESIWGCPVGYLVNKNLIILI